MIKEHLTKEQLIEDNYPNEGTLIIDCVEETKEHNGLEKYIEMDISIIEFAIINNFLFKCTNNEYSNIKIDMYGKCSDSTGRITFGGVHRDNEAWWFSGEWSEINGKIILQTRQYKNSYDQLCHTFSISINDGILYDKSYEVVNLFKKIAYNNSDYKGKCLKIKVFGKSFDGIEILDTADFNKNIILSETQDKFLKHYVNRIKRGNTARYLLNGVPGTGKTEVIRKIVHSLIGDATFIIPEFREIDDLINILESCNIFDPGVLIIDDIDLYLGSRSTGRYSTVLGEFLSFFDGVKKNKISILASTNDKELVDKAAERPGRFNMTLDFGYLNDEQIEDVCKIHLDNEWLCEDVYKSLKGKDDNGNKINITGAFIANLGENIREMSQDYDDWGVKDTISLIKEVYKGFYSSQISKTKNTIGFKKD